MIQDLAALEVVYMNKWGCEHINHSPEEINEMGEAYYDKFFLPEETKLIIPQTIEFCKRGDHSEIFSFFQQVRTGTKMEPKWHYTVCKFLRDDTLSNNPKIILISNPVSGMGYMVNKVNNLLDENVYITKNYKKFALLTKREKEVISLVADGKSTNDIADLLFISPHTVSTHRKNIANKLGITTFSELLKFAKAFELIK